jgi:uncharacterized protein YggE
MKLRAALSIIAASVASICLFGGAAAPQPDVGAKPAPSGPTITVSGSGEVERKPDYAVVHVGIQAREKTATKASEKAGAAMKAISEALRDLRLDGMQLQTSGVSLNPAYVWRNQNGEQQQDLIGYDASSILRVRIDDPGKVGDVIDAAIGAGANRINSVSFELKEALKARQEALTMAAEAARDKAQTLAAALGLKITGVVTATASADNPPWQPVMANRSGFAAAEAAPGLGEGIEPGMVTVHADATVTFAAVEAR